MSDAISLFGLIYSRKAREDLVYVAPASKITTSSQNLGLGVAHMFPFRNDLQSLRKLPFYRIPSSRDALLPSGSRSGVIPFLHDKG